MTSSILSSFIKKLNILKFLKSLLCEATSSNFYGSFKQMKRIICKDFELLEPTKLCTFVNSIKFCLLNNGILSFDNFIFQ